HAMAPTKRTAVVPQAPVHGIDVGAVDYSESATMASALIFLHLTLPAIDRTFAHRVSPHATAVETLCVTRRGPLTVDYILPPTCVALSSAIMSISTHAPNGTCATLTALRAALRAWMPRSPNTWTSSSDAPATTRRGSVKFGAPLTMTKSFAILRLIINGSGASRDFGLVKTPWRIEGP